MTLKDHYKFHSRKSIKPYSRLLVVIVLSISVFYTVARYISSATSTITMEVAKWSIKINNETITSNTSTLSQTMPIYNVDGSTSLKKGSECYFEITIDPSLTEVALSYSISIDLTSGNHPLPTGTTIDYYEIFTGSSYTLSGTENVNDTSETITGSYSLVEGSALSNSDIVKYRIHCVIPNDAVITNGEEFNIVPVITLQQEI